jgi:hypothetical protein
MRVSGKRDLRRIFGPKREEVRGGKRRELQQEASELACLLFHHILSE